MTVSAATIWICACQSYIILPTSSHFHFGNSPLAILKYTNVSHPRKRKVPEEAAVDKEFDWFFPVNAERVSVNKTGFIELANIPEVRSSAYDLI